MLPQLIYLGITVLGLGVVLAKNGEPQEPYSFWKTILVSSIILCLLYWGGFFNCFKEIPY